MWSYPNVNIQKELYLVFVVLCNAVKFICSFSKHTMLKICSVCVTDTDRFDPISEIDSSLRRMPLPASVYEDTRYLCSNQLTFVGTRHYCDMKTYSEFFISWELIMKLCLCQRMFVLNFEFDFFQKRGNNCKLTDW